MKVYLLLTTLHQIKHHHYILQILVLIYQDYLFLLFAFSYNIPPFFLTIISYYHLNFTFYFFVPNINCSTSFLYIIIRLDDPTNKKMVRALLPFFIFVV